MRVCAARCCTATRTPHAAPSPTPASTPAACPATRFEGFAFFEESLELSRRFRALKLWLSLRYHGIDQFRAAIRKDLEHAQLLARLITAEPTLELLAPVELSTVCFRWKDASEVELDRRNAAILREVIRRGRVYLSNARVRGAFALRACIVNHRTTDADIAAIAEEVAAAAAVTAGARTRLKTAGAGPAARGQPPVERQNRRWLALRRHVLLSDAIYPGFATVWM